MPLKQYGPGAGKYLLPPTVGYPNHDTTKWRNPQYSMGLKTGLQERHIGPGPKYNLTNLTSYGRVSQPAYSITSRHKETAPFQTPGPGTYKSEQVPRMKEARPPAYSMSWRSPGFKGDLKPGPDRYTLPTSLGPKVPDLRARPAYTMSSKQPLPAAFKSPGPANYDGIPVDMIKSKPPKYTISPRLAQIRDPNPKPGPADYFPQLHKIGGYSFGLRTDNMPMITPEDEIPCVIK